MLCAILNKSWRQHSTNHQLCGHLAPITKTIQVIRTRHAGHCWRSRDELISDVLLWTPHMAEQKQDDQLEHTFSSYVRIRDLTLKTCQRWWTIGRSGERGAGISVLVARHDDIYIYIYIYVVFFIFVGPKREKKVNISKRIGPLRDLYIFKNYLFLYFVLVGLCLCVGQSVPFALYLHHHHHH